MLIQQESSTRTNSPVPHHRAWSQAVILEQILPGSDLIWSRSVIDIQYVRVQNHRVFFLKISKEVGKAWRKSNTREPHTPFSASFQTFCVTAHAYLNTPKSVDGRFWSLHKHVCVPKKMHIKARCIKYSETNNKINTGYPIKKRSVKQLVIKPWDGFCGPLEVQTHALPPPDSYCVM